MCTTPITYPGDNMSIIKEWEIEGDYRKPIENRFRQLGLQKPFFQFGLYKTFYKEGEYLIVYGTDTKWNVEKKEWKQMTTVELRAGNQEKGSFLQKSIDDCVAEISK